MTVSIREMMKKDWEAVADIYQQGINTGRATFQTEIPSYEMWDQTHIGPCRLVAIVEDSIVGWTALSPVSSRCVYAGVAEVSVYVRNGFRGKRIGELLLKELILQSEEEGYWMLQSGILEQNSASIALHKKVGFRMVGFREKIAKDSEGVWQNTVLMERRSQVIGV